MTPLFFFIALFLQSSTALVSLRTSTRIPGITKEEALDFLATARNWPEIVLSSWDVKGCIDKPLRKGDIVEEIFGLPPILPLSVAWTCVQVDRKAGILDVRSPEGVPGVASDCRMLFNVQEENGSVRVDLCMEYQPRNLIGNLAIPVLTLDNTLAVKILLPNAILQQPKTPLDDFRNLMGTLYGVAGIAHFADCLVGPSQLLVAAGCPTFYELPTEGKLLALLWCAAGPAAFVASRIGKGNAGLVGYGLVEVACAAVATSTSTATIAAEIDPVTNAIAVQAIVAASWLYSAQKQPSE
jgi:hypothetical protein